MAQGLIEAGNAQARPGCIDLGLPDGDGVQFLVALRAWSSAPVLVLSPQGQRA